MKLFNNLSKIQIKAVIETDGPVMIIAGAGSGKTRVLTHRILYLLKYKNINISNILTLTFTNKAAKEVEKRIFNSLKILNKKKLWIGTFHSVFAKILRLESDIIGYEHNYTIYDRQDSEFLIKRIIKEMKLNKEIYNYKNILSSISKYKNNSIFLETFNKNKIWNNINYKSSDDINKIYIEYSSRCLKSSAMDFDDILINTYFLLKNHPNILKKYQNIFKYILIDEYQDINNIQYSIIKMLTLENKNICIVGDDSQSIYGFRGAKIYNILNFKSNYLNTKIFNLEQNYRSTYNIVQASNNLISYNRTQLKKNIWTKNEVGEKIIIHNSSSNFEEAIFVVKTIKKLKNIKSLDNNNFAILYRNNIQSRLIEQELNKNKIFYKIYGGISFYQRKEIKNLIFYFKTIINPKDNESILKIINFPPRGIGKITINKLIKFSLSKSISIYSILENIYYYNKFLNLSKNILSKIEGFILIIKKFINKNKLENAYVISKDIIEEINIKKIFENKKNDFLVESNSIKKNINEFLNNIKIYVKEQNKLIEGDKSLNGFVLNVLFSSYNEEDTIKNNYISMMTIHLSKGLEFPIVFIIGLEENILPSKLSINSINKLEEERRLFYVALTRAQKKIFISYSNKRYDLNKIVKNKPSRFINEMKNKNKNYKFN